jgi:transposase InsO family protein
MTLKLAAAAFNVSPATAHCWWHRWLEAGEEARAKLSCLFDRSSRPHRSPRQLAPELAEAICACRRQTGWGPRLVAGATGFCHSTVWKVLKRAGISRPPRAAREPANSYEWPCPGDLLHMDTSEYVRFRTPVHSVTGDRSSQDRQHRDGLDFAHAIVDDHSRLAYAEIHPDQRYCRWLPRAGTRLLRRPRHRRETSDDRQRLDHVRSRAVRELLARNEIRQLTTKPYRPRTNGKVERFHQTMAREWAYGLVYCSHTNAPPHCHTGSTTTTGHGHTALSEDDPRSAAFTTSVGRTSRPSPPRTAQLVEAER